MQLSTLLLSSFGVTLHLFRSFRGKGVYIIYFTLSHMKSRIPMNDNSNARIICWDCNLFLLRIPLFWFKPIKGAGWLVDNWHCLSIVVIRWSLTVASIILCFLRLYKCKKSYFPVKLSSMVTLLSSSQGPLSSIRAAIKRSELLIVEFVHYLVYSHTFILHLAWLKYVYNRGGWWEEL